MDDAGGAPRRKKILFFLAVVAVLAAAALIVWWRGRGLERTDDAQVEGPVHPVSARVAGYVQKVLVKDNDAVKEGDVLVTLDPSTFESSVRSAEADVAAAEAASRAASRDVEMANPTLQAAVAQARANLAAVTAQATLAEAQHAANQARERNARGELERTRPLVDKELASPRRLEHLQAAWDEARAGVEASGAAVTTSWSRLHEAEARLAEARARLPQVQRIEAAADAARAQVEVAKARLEKARLDLGFTTLRAPAAGVVTKKFTETGQYVSPGQALMLVVPLDDTWVTANFKETQVAHMRPGMEADVTVDSFHGLTIRGTVDSISAGTGARFSLLPPENATGNFVKVVQRIPVKIIIVGRKDDAVLRPGMNAVVTVKVGTR